MIDYNKLREAMELAEKYKFNKTSKCAIKHTISFLEFGGHICEYELILSDGVRRYASIDSLIATLRKLTEPAKSQPKYAVGQLVWRLGHDEITSFVIMDIIECEGEWLYRDTCEVGFIEHGWRANHLYSTREDLIKSQIEYWHGLLFPEDAKSSCCSVHAGTSEECARPNDTHKEPEECKHEPMLCGQSTDPNYIPEMLCLKCGEFYR